MFKTYGNLGLFQIAQQLSICLIILLSTASTPQPVSPQNDFREIKQNEEFTRLHQDRVFRLTKFLENRNSPLISEAETFITTAENNNIDWRLLPAIACVESGCGAVVPYTYNLNSFNPFGWGVTATSTISFSSWQTAIESVGEKIASNYYAVGLDYPYEIERVYNPISSENGHTWNNNVNWFIAEISSGEYMAMQ